MEAVDIAALTDFKIGQVCDHEAVTGCTVVICPAGAVAGVDVRGGSPGTRDTDALHPVMNRRFVHAVLLAGGSAFGLDAAAGVMRDLEERGVGRDVGVTVVPNVSAAVLFDLALGRPDIRPDAAMGYEACQRAWAGQAFQSGSHGVGVGATVGKSLGLERAMKGGQGAAAFRQGELLVGALVAVNCVGDVQVDGRVLAGARGPDGGFVDSAEVIAQSYRRRHDLFSGAGVEADQDGGHTVLICLLSNARLSKAEATKLAQIGHDGLARRVRPAHSVFDGDTSFALCAGAVDTSLDAACAMAAAAVEAAIVDAVVSASGLAGLPAQSDLIGPVG
ncbi:MAG: P1 family peptidase [Propionibacteriaceae bacterium]|jgi:L-aminopeptidase/D-esterase-like protein|nr:P1 family peptidase [Propionibacteriaceae bacterium]